jgi:hypothetical protein
VFGGPIPVTVGYVLKETIEKSPDLVQAYVNACYRAQQWIHRAKDDEVTDLLWKPYMETLPPPTHSTWSLTGLPSVPLVFCST